MGEQREGVANKGAPTTQFKHSYWGPTHTDLFPHSAWGEENKD